jgi:hypothetical protein
LQEIIPSNIEAIILGKIAVVVQGTQIRKLGLILLIRAVYCGKHEDRG